jgi:hypothetical protein
MLLSEIATSTTASEATATAKPTEATKATTASATTPPTAASPAAPSAASPSASNGEWKEETSRSTSAAPSPAAQQHHDDGKNHEQHKRIDATRIPDWTACRAWREVCRGRAQGGIELEVEFAREPLCYSQRHQLDRVAVVVLTQEG